jgi:hypothetical protein
MNRERPKKSTVASAGEHVPTAKYWTLAEILDSEVCFVRRNVDLMVARGGIEPPTRGFSVIFLCFRGLINQPLATLASPLPNLPRHNHGTPSLGATQCWQAPVRISRLLTSPLTRKCSDYYSTIPAVVKLLKTTKPTAGKAVQVLGNLRVLAQTSGKQRYRRFA